MDELVLSQNKFEGRLPLELIDLAHRRQSRRHPTAIGSHSSASHNQENFRPRDQNHRNRQRNIERRSKGDKATLPKLLIELQDNNGLNLNKAEMETDSQTLRVLSSLTQYGCEVVA